MKSKALRPSLLALLFALPVYATPPNTIIMDGVPTEYDAVDLRGTFGTTNAWDGNVITNVYVTWDANHLYIALQGWENGNKLVVMLDADPGEGTGATTTTDWVNIEPDTIRFNCVGWQADDATGVEFGLDYMLATEGFFNNILRITYDGDTLDTNEVAILFDQGNGATPHGTPVDMVVYAADTTCDLRGFEARIPWSELYTDDGRFGFVDGNVVPTGATIRLFANIHNNEPDSSFSAPDAIPQNDMWNAGLLTTTNYIDVVIDGDFDGVPDLAFGDVNAPFLRSVVGMQGQFILYARFNEPVTEETATNTANWLVDGVAPLSVTNPQPDVVFLHLNDPLPASTNEIVVSANGVEDASANSKFTHLCMSPADSGLTNAMTVRFVVDSNFGMGLNPFFATNIFINGSAAPLEWGYPPSMSSPMSTLSGSLKYRDVIFPPGTPSPLFYKYSARISGTNNYEAVRLANYADAARVFTFDPNVTTMVITDYLGAAAAPYRDPGTNTGYNALYLDNYRGHAGVHTDAHGPVSVTFQLDLSLRNLVNVQRVLIQGTDPLRGFNVDDEGVSDSAGGGAVGWDVGGLTLYDDGTHGDLVAGDGIYSRTWRWTASGTDSTAEPGFPHSLVGGNTATLPYAGFGWFDGNSPRSFKYQFYVYDTFGNNHASPGFDIEHYIEPRDGTNIVLPPHVWNNDAIPLPPPSNAPTVIAVSPGPGSVTIQFTNQASELQHGVEVATDLVAGWLDYGQIPANLGGGNWEAVVQNFGNPVEFVRAKAAPPPPYTGIKWTPNPVPDTGATVRIYFTQYGTPLAGDRNVQIVGDFNGWTPESMTFIGNGLWSHEVVVDELDGSQGFKLRDGNLTLWYTAWGVPPDGNYPLYKGVHHATWDPESPEPGDVITITYDAAGGPFLAPTNVNAHAGFDEGWSETGPRTMTNIGGTVWQTAFPIPTNYRTSVNFVFNEGGTNWHSENDAGGRAWRAFLKPIGNE